MTPAAVRSIPFFDYRAEFLSEEDTLVEIFRETGRRGKFILQEDLERFERNLGAFCGAAAAIGVANATDGLHLALRAAGIGSGDEVIFSSHTMVATAAAIHFAGATPIPVDCGSDHLIDPAAVESAITPRTRAILPTHLNGRTCAMDALEAVALRHSLVIIEDAAQALGSKFRGRSAGTFGAAGAISFYPAKILGCLGDGGAVLTRDASMLTRLRELRDHGRAANGEIVSWGLNSRLDNLQAAILDYRLTRLPRAIEHRRALARIYTERLGPLEELVLPPPPAAASHFDVFQNYEIEAARRDALKQYLQSRGIGTLIPWGGKAVHQWPGLKFPQRLGYTELLFEKLLLLPMNAALPEDQAHIVADAVGEFYRS
jgi:dTDP-4-amino-4,6-dideoxygalactose transaminase